MSTTKSPKALEKCLNPNCHRTEKCRGLCHVCYTSARNLIVKGLTTWTILVNAGKARPTNHGPGYGKVKEWLLN